MKTSYIAIHLILLLIPTIYAKEQHEFEYFSFPSPNSVYKSGDSVKFSAEDVPDEGTTTSANLHRADGSFVKTLQSWSAEQIDMSDELFDFNWVVDVDESGSYYVEMVADESPDEVTRSYSFTIEADDEAGSLPDDTEEPQQPATTSFNDEEGGPEEEGGHGSSIHQVQSSEENNNEFQEEPEEIDEPSEHNNRKKLSLHNDQTKVAHIASHNDIDTVSDEPSNSMTHRPPPSQHQSAKIVTQQQEKTSSPNNLLTKVVDDVKHTAGLASNDNKHHQQKQPSHEKENPQEPQDLKVLHPPEINDSADMKTLMAADKQAIEQEKLWIQQSKNGGGPKKMILEGLTGSLGNNNKKTTTTTHHKSTTTTKTTTTHHKSIPKVGHQQEQKQPIQPVHHQQPPSKPAHQQQPPLSHEAQEKLKESQKEMEEKQEEMNKKIEEAKKNAKENPLESKQDIKEAKQQNQEDIQKLTLEQQEELAEQQSEDSKAALHHPSPIGGQYHTKQVKEAALKNKSSHEKRNAVRKVLSNRAKFSKSLLQ